METSKRPLVLHEAATPYLLLWIALMIPNRLLAATTILPLLVLSYYNLLQTTSPSIPASYVVGSYVAYHALCSIDLLLLRDPRTEFRRLPIRGGGGKGEKEQEEEEEGEAYPHDLKRRIGWTLDLLLTMRGVGWSWKIRSIPPLSAAEIGSRSIYLRRRFITILWTWVWLDLSMFFMHHVDRAYYIPPGNSYESSSPRGPVYPTPFSLSTRPQQNPPPLGFPAIPPGMPGLPYRAVLYISRHLLQGTLIYVALNGAYTVTAVAAVLAGALLGTSAGWRRRHLHHSSWPNLFGRWSTGDWGRGVAGWWSKGWHGLFKNAFTAPSRYLARRYHQLHRSSPAALAAHLVFPFVLSGVLHYAGAHTRSGDGWGSARFFWLQPVGVGVELAFARGLARAGRWGGYVWAVLWLVMTSGSFFEELRYGGVWAIQLVPVSVWKWGAGMGAWCWGRETAVGWRSWWEWDQSAGGWGVGI